MNRLKWGPSAPCIKEAVKFNYSIQTRKHVVRGADAIYERGYDLIL